MLLILNTQIASFTSFLSAFYVSRVLVTIWSISSDYKDQRSNFRQEFWICCKYRQSSAQTVVCVETSIHLLKIWHLSAGKTQRQDDLLRGLYLRQNHSSQIVRPLTAELAHKSAKQATARNFIAVPKTHTQEVTCILQ